MRPSPRLPTHLCAYPSSYAEQTAFAVSNATSIFTQCAFTDCMAVFKGKLCVTTINGKSVSLTINRK